MPILAELEAELILFEAQEDQVVEAIGLAGRAGYWLTAYAFVERLLELSARRASLRRAMTDASSRAI